MNLTTWNPFREMDELLNRYHRSLALPSSGESDFEWTPAVDIKESEKEYLVETDLPGVDKKDINVSVHNGVLTVSGERRVEKEDKDEKHHRTERFYGKFTRSFSLPDDVAEDKIDAECKNGIVKIHLPKTEEKQPKSIEVKVN